MNAYELLLMLDPELPEERQGEIVARMRELVERGNGTWASHDVWGRRRLAFEIDKKTDGAYHLVAFEADPATLDELGRVLRITDGVMRHMATRRLKPPSKPQSQAAPPREAAPPPEPADAAVGTAE